MVAIVDYGVGNLFSLVSSFKAIGVPAVVTRDACEIEKADKIVLPGVGAFGDAIEKLRKTGLDKVIIEQVKQGKQSLGICLGMQCMIVEYARNVLGLADANSREMNETTPNNVVDIMEEAKAHLNDTMRMGNFDCALIDGSKLKDIYGVNCIQERHHHRYERAGPGC